MSDDKKHSPLPWKLQPHGLITDADGQPVSFIESRPELVDLDWTNANLIVRAVNNHERLLQALRELKGALENIHDGEPMAYSLAVAMDEAHAALKQVESDE